MFETNTETDTSTATSTTLITSTVTGAAPTSTIGPAAGFTPIQSVYGPNGKSARAEPTNILIAREAFLTTTPPLPICTSTVTQTSTFTVNTEAPTPTATATETTTVTSTTKILLTPAEVTVSSTQTDQVTTTTTETSTTTNTEFAGPTPTFYSICSEDNQLSSYRGVQIGNAFPSPGLDLRILPGVAGGYDCCAAAFSDPSFRLTSYSTATSSCYVYYAGGDAQPSCDATQDRGRFVPGNRYGAYAFTVYNSNCGRFVPEPSS